VTKVGVADPGHAPCSVPPLAKQHEGTDDPGSLFVVATLPPSVGDGCGGFF